MPRSRRVVVTNPAATRLPRPRGTFGSPAPVQPISPLPRKRVGEQITRSEHVVVTNDHPRAQQKRQGDF